MNSNINEEGQKPTKPHALQLKQHYVRTVSANPTLSESVGSNVQSQGTDKEAVKLNTNAPAFVPKEKRSISQTETKESQSTPTTTTPTPTGYGQPQQTFGMGGYPMNMPPQHTQKSFLNYTYLNPQGGNMMYPMGAPVGYSPNTRTGTFFPQMGGVPPQMPTMGYPNYMGAYPQQQKTPYTSAPTTMGTTPMPTTTMPLSTTTTAPTPDKKIMFNKDSKVFVPKALREKQVEEGERKMSLNESKEKETSADMSVSPLKEREQQEQIEHATKSIITPVAEEKKVVKEEPIKEPTSVIIPEQIQTPLETEKIEVKADTKKSKLKDIFDAPMEKKPALAPKSTVPNKKVITTTPSLPIKDKDRTFEEKRKQYINLQKQEKTKTPAPQQSKKREPEPLTTYIAPSKEETSSKASSETTPFPSDEEDNAEAEPKKSYKLERYYFLQEENKPIQPIKHTYNVDYIMSFKNWKICEENKLLDNMLIDHIRAMGIWEDERPKGYKSEKRRSKQEPMATSGSSFTKGSVAVVEDKMDKSAFSRSMIKTEQPATGMTSVDLNKWGRKDMSAIEKEATEYKMKFDEEKKKDPLKNELTECLNQLTVDNYEDVKYLIYEKVKNEVNDQIKLLEVLFKKAVTERSFVTLYARLCKDLDRDVPQKSEKDKRTSQMRTELLNKCREIFKVDNVKLNQFIKIDNEEEREGKLKKFLLGNVNFIGELINAKLLSKKIVFQCINNLFIRIEKQDEQHIQQINLEAIVILMDKFGTLINKYDSKTKPEELADFNKRIDDYLTKLDGIQVTDKSLPGHVRYKIINLIEKRKRGWEESKVDKTATAKGIKEVREEYESEQRVAAGRGGNKLDQDAVNDRIKQDLYAFRSHIKDGYPAEEYRWEITEQLIKKHKNTLGEILTAFGENCIDFVGKEDDIQYAYLYCRDIITYYSQKMDKRDRNELLDVTLFFLQNLSDFSLDNHLLVDVWGGVIYLLEFCGIFKLSDIDSLKEVQEDQLNTIFEVVNNALGYYDKKDDKLKELNSTTLVKANKSLFQSIVSEIS